MKAPTIELKLPVSGVTVFLRQWVTNGQVEYSQEPIERLAEANSTGVPLPPGTPLANVEAAARGREVFTEKIVVPAADGQPEQVITEQEKMREFYNELPAVDVGTVNLKINDLVEADKKKLPGQPT